MTESERVGVVRKVHEAFNRGDTEAMLAVIDSEVVIRDPDRTGGTFRGHDELLGFLHEWLESWDDYRFAVKDYREADDWIVASLMQGGRGKGSGVEVQQPVTQLLRVRDGKVTELVFHADRAEALRAAGLNG